MKRKKIKWENVLWTPFVQVPVDPANYTPIGQEHAPEAQFINSRYQVSLWYGDGELGPYIHLSFKVHDRQAHHDWRDMQRIKNELVGPEYEAIEIFPAESRLVDCANQYHLYVFRDWKIPVGFQERLVSEGTYLKSKQRPFEERPSDCVTPERYAQMLKTIVRDAKEEVS